MNFFKKKLRFFKKNSATIELTPHLPSGHWRPYTSKKGNESNINLVDNTPTPRLPDVSLPTQPIVSKKRYSTYMSTIRRSLIPTRKASSRIVNPALPVATPSNSVREKMDPISQQILLRSEHNAKPPIPLSKDMTPPQGSSFDSKQEAKIRSSKPLPNTPSKRSKLNIEIQHPDALSIQDPRKHDRKKPDFSKQSGDPEYDPLYVVWKPKNSSRPLPRTPLFVTNF